MVRDPADEGSQQLGQHVRGPGCPVGRHGAIAGGTPDLGGDRLRQDVRGEGLVVQPHPGAVPVQAVSHVEVLLEVVSQRDVEEGATGGRQLHRRGQASLDDGQVRDREVPVEVRHELMDLETVACPDHGRVDARAGDHDHAQAGDPVASRFVRVGDPAQQVTTHPGAADGDHAHPLVRPPAELGAQPGRVGHRARIDAGDVATEVVVLLRPVPDQGEAVAEGQRHDVVGLADEDGPVAQVREALDVLDHLGVVVGSHEPLALVPVGHREVPDEVGQPRVGVALELGVLVQEVVDVPALVRDHEVVVALPDDIVEDVEVADQDLVHATQRLEAVEVVLAGLALDVPRLAGQPAAGRVQPLTGRLEHPGDGVLCQPVDLDVLVPVAQLLRDRDVAAGVAEADR